MGVFRIEHSSRMPRKTTLLIATPVMDMVPTGGLSVMDEVVIRIKNLIVDNQLPLDHPSYSDAPVPWSHADAGSTVYERGMHSVLDSLRYKGFLFEELTSLKTALQTLPIMAYRFNFDTDPRFVNRGLDMIHSRLFNSLMELAARRQTMVDRISDMRGGL